MLRRHWRLVQEGLGDEDGVLTVDGSDFPKQGTHSVGVPRQWCGMMGKVDNCQVGVFLGYASSRGHTLLDRRLFLPEKRFTPAYAERREKWGAAGTDSQNPTGTGVGDAPRRAHGRGAVGPVDDV